MTPSSSRWRCSPSRPLLSLAIMPFLPILLLVSLPRGTSSFQILKAVAPALRRKCWSPTQALSRTEYSAIGFRLRIGSSDDDLFRELSSFGDGSSSSSSSDKNNPNKTDDTSSPSSSQQSQILSDRISQIEKTESSFLAGLQKRVQRVEQAEELEKAMSYDTNGREETLASEEEGNSDGNTSVKIVNLPVITMDALLPKQTLSGSTTDPTFCNLLRTVGLGGSFVMTSLNNRQRKVRRFGVVAKIELVDVEGDENDGNNDGSSSSLLFSSPTAVAFSIVGKRRCEILGSCEGMKSRIGRWRRSYDPDGEESRLGWGEERFVDKSLEESAILEDGTIYNRDSDASPNEPCTKWTTNQILIIDESSEDDNATSSAIAKATYLLPLIEQWIHLASNPDTYYNTKVVAGIRSAPETAEISHLSINPEALIRNIQKDLGPMPSPKQPTALAVWGAALINPLPALGVAPEVRGAVLEAEGAERKLTILERGLIKSIWNLEGTKPLGF